MITIVFPSTTTERSRGARKKKTPDAQKEQKKKKNGENTKGNTSKFENNMR